MANVPRFRLDDERVFAPQLDPLTDSFIQDQQDIDARIEAQEGAGRFAEPRIRRRTEDVEADDLYPGGRTQAFEIASREPDDKEIAADAIIQAAQDLASQGWEPTRWNTDILRMPEGPQTNYYGQAHEGQLPYDDRPPTLGNRMQQPVRSPIPGIAVDSSGQQYPVQNVQPPNAVQALGAGAVLNVPLATTGFALTAYETIFQKFPELVDMLASGKYRTDDPEIISRATDVAGIVTSGSFANRVAQEAGRARQAGRVARSEETGEPFYRSDDITLNINSTRDGRFNVDARVGDEQAVDLYVRNLQTRPNDPNAVLQFGHAYIDEPWQRQGISTAVQSHLEAITGKPFIPDSFLTEAAYARWSKLDPESVKGHVKQQVGDNEIYWQRSQAADIADIQRTGTPWTETARMAEVRRAYAAGELHSPLGPNGEFTLRGAQRNTTLGTGGTRDEIPPWRMEELENQQVQSRRNMNSFDDLPPNVRAAVREYGDNYPPAAGLRRRLDEGMSEADVIKYVIDSNRRPPNLGMGAATDSGLGGGARPRNLDRAGYYSHAEETVGNLQQRRGTPQQMWASIEKQIREPEIRQLGLDEAILGPALAGSRRFVVDQTADLARFRQELKELGTAEGQDRWIGRRYQGRHHEEPENSALFQAMRHQARDRQAELQRMIPAREEALRGHVQRHAERMQEISGTRASVNRDDILAAIQERRPQVRESNYAVYQRLTEPQIRDARAAMAGPGKDWTPFINELTSNSNWTGGVETAGQAAMLIRSELDNGGKRMGAMISAISHRHKIDSQPIYDAIKKLTGHDVSMFTLGTAPAGTRPLKVAKATLDPANPTLRWRTLSVQGESNSIIENLWRSIPDAEARTLRSVWRREIPEMLEGGFTRNQLNAVEELRRKHGPKLDRIRAEEVRGNYIDTHFEETNIFGHYASSLQRLPDGGTTLTVSQAQSTWFDKIRAGKNLPEHGLVANQEAWLDPVLRRIIKDAVDQGASSITLPNAETVFRYNPPGDARAGLVRFYDETVPRRLRAMMREIDDGYKARGDGVETRLHTLEDAGTQYRQEGQHSGTVARIGGEIEDVRHGFKGNWLRFDLTPYIIRHHRQSRGMRLQSAGVPVIGEEDGSEE